MPNPVHTVLGKYSKYEIYRRDGFFSYKFYIYKNGSYLTGDFASLPEATKYAESLYYD